MTRFIINVRLAGNSMQYRQELEDLMNKVYDFISSAPCVTFMDMATYQVREENQLKEGTREPAEDTA